MSRGRYSRLQRRRQSTPIKRMTRTSQLNTNQGQSQQSPQGYGNYGQPTSQTTTTTKEAPQQSSNTGGLLTSAMAGKEAVDQLASGYKDGQKVQEGLLSGWESAKDYADQAITGMSDFVSGTNTLRDMSQLGANGQAELMNMAGGGNRAQELLGLSTPTVVDPIHSSGLYHTGLQVDPAVDAIDEAVVGGGQKFTEAGQSTQLAKTGFGNMPDATFGNFATGLGNAYAMGSGFAEGNWGQGIGGTVGLAMMTNPATLPFAWIPALAGGLLDDWV